MSVPRPSSRSSLPQWHCYVFRAIKDDQNIAVITRHVHFPLRCKCQGGRPSHALLLKTLGKRTSIQCHLLTATNSPRSSPVRWSKRSTEFEV